MLEKICRDVAAPIVLDDGRMRLVVRALRECGFDTPNCAPHSTAKPGENIRSGGVSGTELLRGIIEALPTRLEEGGTAYIVALYPNPERPSKAISTSDWEEPFRTGMFSTRRGPYPAGTTLPWRQECLAFRSLRRSLSGKGWWREVGGKGTFFHSDGSCAVVSDHDGS
jgi:hypothetical protein